MVVGKDTKPSKEPSKACTTPYTGTHWHSSLSNRPHLQTLIVEYRHSSVLMLIHHQSYTSINDFNTSKRAWEKEKASKGYTVISHRQKGLAYGLALGVSIGESIGRRPGRGLAKGTGTGRRQWISYDIVTRLYNSLISLRF